MLLDVLIGAHMANVLMAGFALIGGIGQSWNNRAFFEVGN